MRQLNLSFLLALILKFSLFVIQLPAISPTALENEPKGKVVLFLMDGVSYKRVFEVGLTTFGDTGKWLDQNASFALLNTMGYGGSDSFRSAMSIACGVRAFGNEKTGLLLEADEPMDVDTALNSYRRRTGELSLPTPIKPFHLLVFPMLPDLLKHNQHLQKKSVPFGVVAQSLSQKGIRIAGIGCGDLVKVINGKWQTVHHFRHGLLIALNEKGAGIGLANQTLLRSHPDMPYGIATNEGKLQQAIKSAWRIADVLVIYCGDTLRADLYGSERLMLKALSYELNLLKYVVEKLSLRRDLLLVFSLAPSQDSQYELSFLLACGKGIVKGGILTSATTSRRGLVSVLDIPATILDFYKVEPIQTINGSRIQSVSYFDPKTPRFSFLFGIGESARLTDSWWRFVALLTWCLSIALSFTALSVSLMINSPALKRIVRLLPLLAVLTVSLHLFSARLNMRLEGYYIAWIISGTSILLLGVTTIFADMVSGRRFILIVFLTSIVFIIDGLSAGIFSFNSPFGYSGFFGGRYYGLGNVGMGLTLGALLALGFTFGKRWLTAILCGFGTVLVGSPLWGANIGGAITGAVLTATVIGPKKWRWLHLLLAILLITILLVGFAVFEAFRSEPITHWGRFIQSTQKEGITIMLSIFWKKLSIALRAFRAVYWDMAFVAEIGLLFSLWLRNGLSWQLLSLSVGSASALLFNDSGPQTPVAFSFLPLCVLTLRTVKIDKVDTKSP